jgi:hypothetical protein
MRIFFSIFFDAVHGVSEFQTNPILILSPSSSGLNPPQAFKIPIDIQDDNEYLRKVPLCQTVERDVEKLIVCNISYTV